MLCDRCWLMIGGLLAGLAVAAGAFAAHGLDRHFHQKYAGMQYEKKVNIVGLETVVSSMPLAQKLLADFKTGAEYQMYHGLALLAVGFLAATRPSKRLTFAGCCFLAGWFGFSGGLYVYTLTNVKWIGIIVVPIGGVLFLVGWGAFIAAVGARSRNVQQLTQLNTSSAAPHR
jgi:uncharacterized membrane protein YgdD (TMEM256/DUF423 family)